jgi:ADP-ribose pyrophosphatase
VKQIEESEAHAGMTQTLEAPVQVSERVDYDSPYLTVRKVVKAMPSGDHVTFYLRDEADVAVCLPVTDDGHLILVKEYRHGPGRELLEIPGGFVDAEEEVSNGAAREVREETGYEGRIVHLGSTWISAYSTARKHIFMMRSARQTSRPQPAPSDHFQVVKVKQEQFGQLVRSGELTDLDAALLCLRALGEAA